jgi:hypothetical protein
LFVLILVVASANIIGFGFVFLLPTSGYFLAGGGILVILVLTYSGSLPGGWFKKTRPRIEAIPETQNPDVRSGPQGAGRSKSTQVAKRTEAGQLSSDRSASASEVLGVADGHRELEPHERKPPIPKKPPPDPNREMHGDTA